MRCVFCGKEGAEISGELEKEYPMHPECAMKAIKRGLNENLSNKSP